MPLVFIEGSIAATSTVDGFLRQIPNTLRWIAVADPLPQGAKHNHASGQFRDSDNRKVLITSGQENSGDFLYDPQTRTWTLLGGGTLRVNAIPCAVYLPPGALGPPSSGLAGPFDGGRVLIIGGDNRLVNVARPSFQYGGAFWAPIAESGNFFVEPKGFYLPNNKVLVFGRNTGLGNSKTRLYDVTTDTWANGPDISYTVDKGMIAVQLPNGNVLCAGGEVSGTPTDVAAVYDWASNTWAATGNNMSDTRTYGAGVLMTLGLFSGQVVVHGGGNRSIQVFDPVLGVFSTPLHASVNERTNHSVHEILDGQILTVFGTSADDDTVAEVYNPTFDLWHVIQSPINSRQSGYTSLSIGQDQVLAVGGNHGMAVLDVAETLMPKPPLLISGSIDGVSDLVTDRILDSNMVGSIDAVSDGPSSVHAVWRATGSIVGVSTLLANAVVVAENVTTFPVGLIEAMTDAIGSADNEIGGMGVTRLSARAHENDESCVVETTFQWPASGTISVDSIVYTYDSKDDTHLYGIKHTADGETTPGFLQMHEQRSSVLDLSRKRNAIDLARRATLVDYAEGEDLSVIGRNLSVLRPPALTDDARYREIIKAIAYNPRGTIYGIELALNGIVGEGNYSIFEDLLGHPNIVFIQLLGSALAGNRAAGKAYLMGPLFSSVAYAATEVDPGDAVVKAVRGVRWHDESHTTTCFTAKPSAGSAAPAPGITPATVWQITGTESTFSSIVATGTRFGPTSNGYYWRPTQIDKTSKAALAAHVNVPSSCTFGSNTGQFVIQLQDGVVQGRIGFQHVSSTTYAIGFASNAGGFVAASGTAVLTKGVFYDIEVRKNGTRWELLVDGSVKVTVFTSDLQANTDFPYMVVGSLIQGNAAKQVDVKSIRFWTHTTTDFWNVRGEDGHVQSEFPRKFIVGVDTFQAGDVGKMLTISGSLSVNAQGGNHNGRWLIDSYVGPREVQLKDKTRRHLRTELSTPNYVYVDQIDAFTFPDDLGKTVTISGSRLGNDGTYVIAKLRDQNDLSDLNSGSSPDIVMKTTVAELTAASFQTEVSLGWTMLPVFGLEGALLWELSDAGKYEDGLLKLRRALPTLGTGGANIVEAWVSQVPSMQVLEDRTFRNSLISSLLPELLYEYYPFYVNDPLGVVRLFIDQLTAAGVKPDFKLI